MTYGGSSETRTYNSLVQLMSLTYASVNLTYNYPAGTNVGKISSMTDAITGETVQYAYDSLNRLITAQTTSTAWGQSFSYDGFGNLLAKNVTQGSAPTVTVSVNSANNQLYGSDANGNSGGAFDVENRLTEVPYPGTAGARTLHTIHRTGGCGSGTGR
jgi:YD repeat-containing protein